MMMDELWLWLCSCPGVYAGEIKALMKAEPSLEELYHLDFDSLMKTGAVDREQAAALMAGKKKLGKIIKTLKDKKIRFISRQSPKFPPKLKDIPTPPYCLYVIGNLPDPQGASCAVVGARACSEYGRRQTGRFASALAAAHIQIISGMALGIDCEAHISALKNGEATFAVLGGGADVIYPRENNSLYYEILCHGGGIISEFPPGTPPLPWQFPHRNRIISGLSDFLLVMEARKRSGSLTTASHALEQGKDIWVLPGRITDPLSEGCNELISDGAMILKDPDSLLEGYLDLPCGRRREEDIEDQTGILKFLTSNPLSADEISAVSGIPLEELCSKLSLLELEGKITEISKDYYIRA